MTKPVVDRPGSPGADPSDEPLASVIDGRTEGDDERSGQFQVVPGGDIRCLTCGEPFPAASLPADEFDRVEGASDPADMAMVLPVRCPHCGTTGALVVRYGPEASADEADLLVQLPRRSADQGPSAST